MLKKIVSVLCEERGPTLLEWAALGVLIILAVWVATTAMGKSIGSVFKDVTDKLGH